MLTGVTTQKRLNNQFVIQFWRHGWETHTNPWWNSWRELLCTVFNFLCDSLMMRRRNWDEEWKFQILKRGQGGNVTQVMMERWGGRDEAWQRAGGVLPRLSSHGRPPGLPVKASSVSPELGCFPWGWAPGSELPEQINREEVLRLPTITPSHMYAHNTFKRNTYSSALAEVTMAVFNTFTPSEGS